MRAGERQGMLAACNFYSQHNRIRVLSPNNLPLYNTRCCRGYLYSIAQNPRPTPADCVFPTPISRHLCSSTASFPLLYPDTFAPQPIHQPSRLHAHPLSDHIEPAAYLLTLLQSPRQELLRLCKPFGLVLRHEQLRTSVYRSKCGTVGIPSRSHGSATGQEEELV